MGSFLQFQDWGWCNRNILQRFSLWEQMRRARTWALAPGDVDGGRWGPGSPGEGGPEKHCTRFQLGVAPSIRHVCRRWLLHLNPDLLKGPFQHSERNLVGLPRDWYDPGAWPEEQGQAEEEQRKEPGEGAQALTEGMWAAAEGAHMEAAARQQAGEGGRVGGGGRSGRRGGVAKPVRGAPAERLAGPLPRLSESQLALLAERLGVFVGVEGQRAASGA